jgi:hypothetical protein
VDHADFDKQQSEKEALFRERRRGFIEAMSYVMGEFEVQFPEDCQRFPYNRDGMAKLGGRIEDLMEVYDRFQASLGIRDGEEPRFAHAFDHRVLRP